MSVLVLVPTRRCNLRCSHCHLVRSGGEMTLAIAKRAVDLALAEYPGRLRIRFLGGEPLLAFNLVRRVVAHAKGRYTGPRSGLSFDLTTNATTLDGAGLRFFLNHPEMDLIVSCYGDDLSQFTEVILVPNVMVNVVALGQNVDTLSVRFQRLLNMGFRRFNILPSYYVPWRRLQIKRLGGELKKIRAMMSAEPAPYLRNMYVNSQVPLFNDALTVDCNGDLFLNNMFLFKPFSNLRKELSVGRVNGTVEFHPRNIDYPTLIRDHLDSDTYESTCAVDGELSRFVHELESDGCPSVRDHHPQL